MNFGISNKCDKIKREDDDEISIETQDTFSQRSLTTQEDEYKEDSFLLIKADNSELDDENSFLDIKKRLFEKKEKLE